MNGCFFGVIKLAIGPGNGEQSAQPNLNLRLAIRGCMDRGSHRRLGVERFMLFAWVIASSLSQFGR